MITDLAAQFDTSRDLETDVAIVGAGIAGLVLAVRLRRFGMRVTVIESGGLEQVEEPHPLNQVVMMGDLYSGAARGRFRCLGGTSTRWGGALLPYLRSDLMDRAHIDLPRFPVNLDDLYSYLEEVEALFGIDHGSYEEDFIVKIGAANYVPTDDPDFQARFAKWPPFRKRNIAMLFGEELKTDRDLEVVLNATATEFHVNAEVGRLVGVRGRHVSGKTVKVCAEQFVICAGAIETTRLLLLMDRQYDKRLIAGYETLGRYFFDHISTKMANLRAINSARLNRMAGFRFVGSTMRSLRFELRPDVQRKERIGSANGHISFQAERGSGFEAIRQVLRGRQRGGSISTDHLLMALRDVPYLARLGFWRAVYHQLLWPRPATYELHVVAEQMPRWGNIIGLARETDMFGLPLASIDWSVTDGDRKTFLVFKRRFEAFWMRQGLSKIANLEWNDGSSGIVERQVDVFHPGGSARIGANWRSAVLNSELGVFGVPNLWVASTAAFPSGGGANPTLTLILFTMRLAEHLAAVTKRGSS